MTLAKPHLLNRHAYDPRQVSTTNPPARPPAPSPVTPIRFESQPGRRKVYEEYEQPDLRLPSVSSF